jgi:hypothetical protein
VAAGVLARESGSGLVDGGAVWAGTGAGSSARDVAAAGSSGSAAFSGSGSRSTFGISAGPPTGSGARVTVGSSGRGGGTGSGGGEGATLVRRNIGCPVIDTQRPLLAWKISASLVISPAAMAWASSSLPLNSRILPLGSLIRTMGLIIVVHLLGAKHAPSLARTSMPRTRCPGPRPDIGPR